MRIGILGSGEVGRTLGTGFVSRGDQVMIGSREPNSTDLTKWKSDVGGRGSTGSFSGAAQFGDLLVLAVLGQAAESVLEIAGPDHFSGKVVIDTTNALDFSKGMPPGLFTDGRRSLSERIQGKVPKAKVVKCFNTVPNVLMVHPSTEGGTPDMLICGDDAAAKAQVVEILHSLGWPRVIDVGGLSEAVWLEAWVPLWVRIGNALGRYDIAPKIVASRSDP
ncbi:MAG TPA: NAD(P)-binding domain-containing protein [Thermoplasmata archaeon]|nr:NAD(P)-binding domain-containing protein [Thermoplasmata archaeon]